MRVSFTRLIFPVFLAALWLPLIAVFGSAQFSPFLRAIHQDPQSFEAERNRLRQATPLWNDAVAGYNRALYAIGVSGRPGAAEIGRDGWMFLGDIFNNNFSQAIGRRVLDDAEVARWTSVLTLQQQWLATRGIPSAFVVAPAKWSIYPEYLPQWTEGLHPVHSLDRLAAAAGPLSMIDLRATLLEAKAQAATYSALDSHWTDYGAWVAWKQIATDLNRAIPALPMLNVPSLRGMSSVDGAGEFEGMLGISATNRVTTYELSQPFSDAVIVAADGSVRPLPGGTRTDLLDLPRMTRNDAAGNRLRVLILRDSTGNALSPFLQNAFHTTYQVDHSFGVPKRRPNLAGLVDQLHPDLVLWIMTERYLNESPGDPDEWRAANDFDCNASDSLGVWSHENAARGFSVDGDATLATPMTVSVDAASGTRILRVDLQAAAAGTLLVESSEGLAARRSIDYIAGANEWFLPLSANVGTLTFSTGAPAQANIRRIEIRAASKLGCASGAAISAHRM
jgi:hypothetical protein